MQLFKKKISASGKNALTISAKEMDNIMKIVKSFEESGLLIKGVNETIKNEPREQKGESFTMLLRILAASWSGNVLASKGVIRAAERTIIAGEGAITTDQGWGTNRIGQYF